VRHLQKTERPAFHCLTPVYFFTFICAALAELTGAFSLCAKKLKKLGFLILLMPLADLRKLPWGERGRRGPATFSSCQNNLAVA